MVKNKVAPTGAPVAELSAKDALAIAVAEARRMAARLQDMNVSDAMSAAHEALALALRDHDPARGPLRPYIIRRVRAQVREAWRRPLRRDARRGTGLGRREVPSDRVHGLDSTEELDIAPNRVVERALHEAALEAEAALERRRLIEDVRRIVGDEVLGLLLSEAPMAGGGAAAMAVCRRLQKARAQLAETLGENKSTRPVSGGGRSALKKG